MTRVTTVFLYPWFPLESKGPLIGPQQCQDSGQGVRPVTKAQVVLSGV